MRVLFVSLVAGGALLSGVGSVNAKAIKLENDALDRVTAGAANYEPSLELEDEALWDRMAQTIVGTGESTSDAETLSLTKGLTIQGSSTGGEHAIAVVSDPIVATSGGATVTTTKSASVNAGDSGLSISGLGDFSSISVPDLNGGPVDSKITTQTLTAVMPGTRGFAAVTSQGSLSGQGGTFALPSISTFGSVSGQR